MRFTAPSFEGISLTILLKSSDSACSSTIGGSILAEYAGHIVLRTSEEGKTNLPSSYHFFEILGSSLNQ